MYDLIIESTWETILMVGISSLASIAFGIPMALLLVLTAKGNLYSFPLLNSISNFLVNAIRSVPYIILTVLIMPFTRILVGSSIGTFAAVVPLSIAGLLLVARACEEALRQVPKGMLEVGLAAGASRFQIVKSILIPEALPSMVASIVTVVVNLIGFSAMAGAVGGGGLGDLAIRYGYQRYDLELMFIIVVVLIVMVQLVQGVGNFLVQKLSKQRI